MYSFSLLCMITLFNYVILLPNQYEKKTPPTSGLNEGVDEITWNNITLGTNNVTKMVSSSRVRVKRQSAAADKFMEAALMPQVKVLRTLSRMVNNIFSRYPIGGRGPFDPETPDAFVRIYKNRLVNYILPEL